VQSTRKRLDDIRTADSTPQRTQLLWLDNPHASEEECQNLIRQAIAEGRMKQTDEVVFTHWEKCLSIDCRICWTDQDREIVQSFTGDKSESPSSPQLA
jgi:hypothetical protein